MKKLKIYFERFKNLLTNEEKRISIQFLSVYLIFALISIIMSIINFITHYDHLMVATIVFAAANIVNFVFALLIRKSARIFRWLFAIESIGLFVFFILDGQPQGFSAIWCAILPLGGLLLYRQKWGTILSVLVLLILIFFFWIPFGRSLLPVDTYTDSFLLRFPLYYIASLAIGEFFEFVRYSTQSKLKEISEKYREASLVDPLTFLGNNLAYLEYIQELDLDEICKKEKYAILMFDLNYLKRTNDIYGHNYGTTLIIEAGKEIEASFKEGKVFHISGDEFVAILKDSDVQFLESKIRYFDENLAYKKIKVDDKELVLSIARGISVHLPGEKFRETYKRADKEMYNNKQLIKSRYNIDDMR